MGPKKKAGICVSKQRPRRWRRCIKGWIPLKQSQSTPASNHMVAVKSRPLQDIIETDAWINCQAGPRFQKVQRRTVHDLVNYALIKATKWHNSTKISRKISRKKFNKNGNNSLNVRLISVHLFVMYREKQRTVEIMQARLWR